MWPKGFRKKKRYTAEELGKRQCERDAEKIQRAMGGEIIHIAPPDEIIRLGVVRPPAGGEITEWWYHRAVQVGDRVYDLMTGPNGLPRKEYLELFEERDVLIIRPLEEQV